MRAIFKILSLTGLVFISTLLSVLLFAVGLRAEEKPMRTTPYVVGVILPLSGPIAKFGEAARNGVELALSTLSEEERAQIVVHYEDDGFSPKNTLTAFKKLKSVNRVDAVIAWGSATSNAVAAPAEESKTILMSISSDPKVSDNRMYAFSHWVTPSSEVVALIPELQRRNYGAIARITATHDFALAVKKAFDTQVIQAKAIEPPMEVVSDIDVNEDLRDFRSILTGLRGKSFKAFLPILFPEQLATFARQARELGFKQEFFGFEMFEDSSVLKLSNHALLDAWFATAGDPIQSFSDTYRNRYPESTMVSAGNSYDVILLLRQAFQSVGRDPDLIAQKLRQVQDFSGALGVYGSAPNNKFGLPAVLKRVAEDGFPVLNSH